jgi:hypothetical protein
MLDHNMSNKALHSSNLQHPILLSRHWENVKQANGLRFHNLGQVLPFLLNGVGIK